jgi:hypothetical protein
VFVEVGVENAIVAIDIIALASRNHAPVMHVAGRHR